LILRSRHVARGSEHAITLDQASAVSRPISVTSIGIRILMASARSTPIERTIGSQPLCPIFLEGCWASPDKGSDKGSATFDSVRNHSMLWSEPHETTTCRGVVVPHTGCLSPCRMRPTALTLAVLERHGQHGSILIRVRIRVQTSRPEPGEHLHWARDYVPGVGVGRAFVTPATGVCLALIGTARSVQHARSKRAT